MPRFVAVYTMKPEDVAAFRRRSKSEQEAIEGRPEGVGGVGQAQRRRHRRDRRYGGQDRARHQSGIADAQNQIAGFLIVEAADITAAAGLFQDHPHITVFPGDGIDVMPVVTGPPED